MTTMRKGAVYVLYGLGHALSKLPYFGWYRLYNWLMVKSGDLDREGWIWKQTPDPRTHFPEVKWDGR